MFVTSMSRSQSNTLVSLSPDGRWRVWLVEVGRFVDRNYELRLEDMQNGEKTTIFSSPDEGEPIGTERIVWSPDSSRFLLLGRHFWAVPEAALPGGEQVYLSYDLQTREVRCNATQSTLPRVNLADALQLLGTNPAKMPATLPAK